MKPTKRLWLGLLILLPVAFGSALLWRWRFGSVADTEATGPGLTAGPLAAQLRVLDSIQAQLDSARELREAPERAEWRRIASRSIESSEWPYATLPLVEKFAAPDSASARILSGGDVSYRPALLRDQVLRPVPVDAAIPPQLLTPLWALSPLAAATFVTRADVASAVVPEPGTLGLLATGIALLVPIVIRRRRRDRLSDPGSDSRAEA